VFPDEDVVTMPSADSIGVGGDVSCHHVAWQLSIVPERSPGGLAWIIHDSAGEKRKGALKD
jgi:hypothetical protein